LAFGNENRVDEVVGGEAGFLHHVADNFGLAVAAGAVGWEHKEERAKQPFVWSVKNYCNSWCY